MKALLDANVLFPTILREILIDLAQAGLYQPYWSDRILDEWRHAAARLGPDQASVSGAEIALLTISLPQASVSDQGARALDLDLPDPADRHVIEAALEAGAALIVTANLRDFPEFLMRRIGLRAIHPDAFLLDLWQRHPDAVAKAARAARDKAARMGGEMTMIDMLKRSRLPRLAKALKG